MEFLERVPMPVCTRSALQHLTHICGSRPSPPSVQGNLREGRCLRVAVPGGGPCLRSSNGVGGEEEVRTPTERAPRAKETRVGPWVSLGRPTTAERGPQASDKSPSERRNIFTLAGWLPD